MYDFDFLAQMNGKMGFLAVIIIFITNARLNFTTPIFQSSFYELNQFVCVKYLKST